MKKEYEIKLLSKKRINDNVSLLTFSCPQIASQSQPGQFVNLSCSRLLKRPFGIASVNDENGTFDIGIREVGEGTKEILSAEPGAMFDCLGPLGNSFPLDGAKKLIFAGGGTGVFPLRFALQRAELMQIPVININGYKCSDDVCYTDLPSGEIINNIICSDVGDIGIKGTVLTGLSSLPLEMIEGARVISVGPEIMMREVSKWASERNLECFVSLEKRMACGLGICLVCTCKINSSSGNAGIEHKRCCIDGPTFRASEVVW
jgi:dihydroorotate dehydrogenase electron transfer subunit